MIDAVKNVSFKLNQGESVGLIGESGCGKSTIVELLLKLREPSDGSIELFGQDICKINDGMMRPLRKDIQVVFQSGGDMVIDPKMTVEELLIEPLKIHQVVEKKDYDTEVNRLMGLIGLDVSERKKIP